MTETSLDSISIWMLVVMYGIGFTGVFAHWIVAARKKQAPWNFFVYMFTDRPGASSSMFITYHLAFGALYSLGTFDMVKWEYVTAAWETGQLFQPFRQAAIEVILCGYTCDSMMNKSGMPEKDRRAEYKELK